MSSLVELNVLRSSLFNNIETVFAFLIAFTFFRFPVVVVLLLGGFSRHPPLFDTLLDGCRHAEEGHCNHYHEQCVGIAFVITPCHEGVEGTATKLYGLVVDEAVHCAEGNQIWKMSLHQDGLVVDEHEDHCVDCWDRVDGYCVPELRSIKRLSLGQVSLDASVPERVLPDFVFVPLVEGAPVEDDNYRSHEHGQRVRNVVQRVQSGCPLLAVVGMRRQYKSKQGRE